MCICCSKILILHSEKLLQKMHKSHSNTRVNTPYTESWKGILPSTGNFHCLLTFLSCLEFSVIWQYFLFFFFFPRSKQREWPHSACSWLSHSEIVCVTAAWIDLKILQPIKCICTLLLRSCSKITGELYNVVIYLKLKWCFKHNGFSTLRL